MDIGSFLQQLISGHQAQSKQQIQRPLVQPQFQMYEDGSYKGDPTQYSRSHPNIKFYEDGTFTSPTNTMSGVPPQQPQQNFLETIQGRSPVVATYQPQGTDNPGYIPLQNSGRGSAGYITGLQGGRNPQRRR